MLSLAGKYYMELILSMRVAKTKGKINIAKPIMLLAIIDGIDAGILFANHIVLGDSLKTLYKGLFRHYTDKYITPIIYPYYYLNSEPFFAIKGLTCKVTPPSAKFIRENVEYAYLDDQLWKLLQDKETREEYKKAIIDFYIKRQKGCSIN